jgi:hypothetical protein
MFKLYFLTCVADVVASVSLNYQLIQNSVEFENLKIKTRVQILKNNIKNSFYKAIGALVPYKTPLHLGLVRQINPYKTRSLIYYLFTLLLQE